MLKKSSETERKIKTRIFKRRERRVKIIPNKRLENKLVRVLLYNIFVCYFVMISQ